MLALNVLDLDPVLALASSTAASMPSSRSEPYASSRSRAGAGLLLLLLRFDTVEELLSGRRLIALPASRVDAVHRGRGRRRHCMSCRPRSVRWARRGGRRQVQPFERSEALIDFPEGDLDGAQPVVHAANVGPHVAD